MSELAGSLDTNVLLRLVLDDVPEQHRVVTKLFNKAEGQFAVSDLAITELVFVLRSPNYDFSRQQIAEIIEGIVQIPGFNCNRNLFTRVLPVYLHHPSLSFEDCCLTVYAEFGDALPLWTFDQKLARQAASARLVRFAE